MSDTKTRLQKRKQAILKRLEPYEKLKQELLDIEKALAAIDPLTCRGCHGGCNECRTGSYYR